MELKIWFICIGSLLLFIGLASSWLKKAPVTGAMVYLIVGLALGPSVFGVFHFNPLKQASLMEVITECAVLISLFSAGVKMPVPFQLKNWDSPIRLAFFGMFLTVAIIAIFAHTILGLQPGVAILLGAILAPTDPVLATDIQLRKPGDKDNLRFSLTAEAGLNDGTAFPFIMLGLGVMGLHDLGQSYSNWIVYDLLWATASATLIGVVFGRSLAKLVRALRIKIGSSEFLYDFIGLGMIGLVYGACLLVEGWGFLGVFVAALSLRHVEKSQEATQQVIEKHEQSKVKTHDYPDVSDEALIFKEHLERLSEVVLVVLIGGTLFIDSWSWNAVALALFVFFIARPAAVHLSLIGSKVSIIDRTVYGWFGVRGIGSLYYLMYAVVHDLPESSAMELIHYTLIVVTLSILIHGLSIKMIARKIWRSKAR